MEKSELLNDRIRSKIVVDEIRRFKKLVDGHKKLLRAIGGL